MPCPINATDAATHTNRDRAFAVTYAPPMNETAQILVRHHVDLKTFREEIVPACKPVVLKGLVEGLAGRAGGARISARARELPPAPR